MLKQFDICIIANKEFTKIPHDVVFSKDIPFAKKYVEFSATFNFQMSQYILIKILCVG